MTRVFTAIVRARWLVVGLYVLLVAPAAWFAAGVQQDNGVDRLIPRDDPELARNEALARTFGGGELAVLLAEADEPYAPAVLGRLDRLERALAAIPHVEPSSIISVFRRAKAGFEATPEQSAALRTFATGTDLFRKQGLVGEGWLAVAVVLDLHDTEARRETLAAVRRAIAETGGTGAPLRALRQVGLPYVNEHLDEETRRMGPRSFGLFALFVVGLTLFLFRSVRTLLAFLITLGVCVALTMGYIGVTGGVLTIVSPMVPMTVLVTATATLVYLQSRFVDRPPDRPVEAHRVFALSNKFVACTASIFATAVGFAALSVSPIAPIREMGQWVAVGLAGTWLTVFTLFPALQTLLRTPTGVERAVAGRSFERLAAWLPGWSYRWRHPLVWGSVFCSALGAVALFGLPGAVSPMRLLVDPVEYISPRSELYRDTRRIEALLPGLSVTEIWLQGKSLGAVSDPEVLLGLDAFQRGLEAEPTVGSVVGPTTIARMISYVGGTGDTLPTDPEALDALAGTLEAAVGQDPLLPRFVQRHGLSECKLTVLSKAKEPTDFQALEDTIRRQWATALAAHPALKVFTPVVTGLAPLQAKVSGSLVPTLVESFYLTVGVIFATFLVVFRSGAARIMAMIPSVFAILVMFGLMRLFGVSLNVATILIASTVLGTSENDQIHFFYHFQEGRKTGDVEAALRHTLSVSGRAIAFATLINAGGFLAFGLAELPPIRQFGLLSAVAFVLSMIADFTALPAALWLIQRARPGR